MMRNWFCRFNPGVGLARALMLGALVSISAAAQAQADPPGRVGRLSVIDGSVSFSPAGSDEWVEASTARPFTSGDRIWIGRNSRAELSVGGTVLRADEETDLRILRLDDDEAQFEVAQGTVSAQIQALDPDDRVEIATPAVSLVPERAGLYRIASDPERDSTEITIRAGQASAYRDGRRTRLVAPSRAVFDPDGPPQVSQNLPWRDGFDRWVDSRVEYLASRQSRRYVGQDMLGYESLDDHGSWREEPGYGAVWLPRVTIVDWAPYRFGHWVWIAPWGWTWVDDAPWGFAPFHYGRWAYIRERWAWVPGPVVRRPCYAPALVAFLGSPNGYGLSVSSGPAVAWFPLGPRDRYDPVYRASPRYVERINRVHRDGPRDGWERPRFENRHIPGATTVMQASAFVEGRAAHRERIRLDERTLDRVPVGATMPSVAPGRHSFSGAGRVQDAPPVREGRRAPELTRRPPPPPAQRDELADRFGRSGWRATEPEPRRHTEERPVPERRFDGRADDGGPRPRDRFEAAPEAREPRRSAPVPTEDAGPRRTPEQGRSSREGFEPREGGRPREAEMPAPRSGPEHWERPREARPTSREDESFRGRDRREEPPSGRNFAPPREDNPRPSRPPAEVVPTRPQREERPPEAPRELRQMPAPQRIERPEPAPPRQANPAPPRNVAPEPPPQRQAQPDRPREERHRGPPDRENKPGRE
ncbi:MAG: hypothetical protein JNJ44_10410 [Zoogloeaceae bacterium]|nr:hypothetical protein [Zoogloeaceae bacterium]